MLFAAAAAGLRAQEAPTSGLLREVRITTSDVFPREERTLLTELVNSLHWQTRREVVAREVWFRPGQTVDLAMTEELERNLRALGLFADVTVRLVASPTPGEVDVVVETRDRLTLIGGVSASYVGGVTGYRASIGEGNMFGQGDRLAASFAENSEGEYRGSLAYSDLHLLDTWHTATVRVGRTDEGDSGGLEVRRPFKHLADPRSYGMSVSLDDTAVDYYRDGDSAAEVPFRRGAVAADLSWGTGPRDARRYLGFTLGAEELEYGTATGPLAPEIRVPGDTWSVYLGPAAAWQWIDSYRKVEGLDTLDYVQDLTLGMSITATAGVRHRDEEGVGSALQPELGAGLGLAAEPLVDLFTNVGARGSLRLESGDAVGWSASAFARAFALLDESHTIASNLVFDGVEETQDLPRELTLGEDTGLRGYGARLFSGTRRVRANLEERFDTGIEYATFRLGLVAFMDAGWIGEGSDLDGPWRSVGCGLRLGSKQLLGDGILRLDVAKPLDDVDLQSDGWKLSVTIGQVFTFGGSAGGLGVR